MNPSPDTLATLRRRAVRAAKSDRSWMLVEPLTVLALLDLAHPAPAVVPTPSPKETP